MAHRIGIDAGSKTIKVVVLNDDDTIAFSIYRRHRFDIATLLASTIHDVIWRYGDLEGVVAFTGSAGIELAQWLDLPFIQEVVATTKAVQTTIPDANAVIELGGEDAKVIYLDEPVEMRMNATCAGGTGGFIDTIAFMLGLRSKDFSQISMGASHIYPIASRCAVFAQTDVRPLLNAGANKADIAASALEAVVRQTLGGLACGRPIRGKVVFLGGPCEFVPDLVRRFQKALNLDRNMGIKPIDAHLFTAQGAALFGGEQNDAKIIRLSDLEARLQENNQPQDNLARLQPLFTSQSELDAFIQRHQASAVKTEHVTVYEGPLYVGMDAGSTAVKLACVSPEGRLIYSDSAPTKGDVLETARGLLETMYTNLPHGYNNKRYYTIDHATVTGYGEDLLRAALNFDTGVVETLAHSTAALYFNPEATFVLDIGGQDMKAIWIEDGVIQETVLNEACSSGCGSFIEGTAYSLRSTPAQFSNLALTAPSPIDLGTKCTVFMTSRVRHAQKIGASISDIAAGIAYSVVQNALFRIIGMNNTDSMGSHIVVQGGAFMSDAVLRAFELISKKKVTRPGCANLMGAYGAALIARDRDFAVNGKQSSESIKQGSIAILPDAPIGRSNILAADQIKQLSLKRSFKQCHGCQNECSVTILTFNDNRCYVNGNRCERAYDYFDLRTNKDEKKEIPPNVFNLKQKLLARYQTQFAKTGPWVNSPICIGIMNTLNVTDQLPFWHTLLCRLGCNVCVIHSSAQDHATKNKIGLETIASESVCFPAKLSHNRLFALLEAGASHIFMPIYVRGKRCPVRSLYTAALQDGISGFDTEQPTFISPKLTSMHVEHLKDNEDDYNELYTCLNEILQKAGPSGASLSYEVFENAFEQALLEQKRFTALVQRGNEQALRWAQAPGHHGIVLAGRPYHVDPVLLHEIDRMLQSLGFAIISPQELGLPRVGHTPDFQSSKTFMQIAEFIADKPSIHMVCLESFGCTYDALGLPEAKDFLKQTGQTYTALKIDEIADIAHIRIRLRTLAETIMLAEIKQDSKDECALSSSKYQQHEVHNNGVAFEPGKTPTSMTSEHVEYKMQNSESSIVPCINSNHYVSEHILQAALEKSADAYRDFSQEDLDVARMFTSDLCYVVAILAGRTIRLVASALAQGITLKELVMPSVCKNCVLEGLSGIVKRVCGFSPEIKWVDIWPNAEKLAYTPHKSSEKELVGIIGAAPLCFEPFLNDNIAHLIKDLGYEVVYPQIQNIFVDDVQYINELERYYSLGVRKVIYLQSFGCLKGHVQARGAAHKLASMFPGMQITVLDYDAEASALNRENRIRLALHD